MKRMFTLTLMLLTFVVPLISNATESIYCIDADETVSLNIIVGSLGISQVDVATKEATFTASYNSPYLLADRWVDNQILNLSIVGDGALGEVIRLETKIVDEEHYLGTLTIDFSELSRENSRRQVDVFCLY